MPSQNRIQTFLEAVYRNAENTAQSMREEIINSKEEALVKYMENAQKAADIRYQIEVAKTRVAVSSEFSHKEAELREELFIQRKNLTENIFTEVKNKLSSFIKTDKYKDFLINTAKQISEVLESDCELLIKEEDQPFEEEIKNAFGKNCKISYTNQIHFGGIIGKTENFIIDNTLDARLEEQRENFIQNSGLKVV